jgi:membrane protease YdiL (CAAX protease family)
LVLAVALGYAYERHRSLLVPIVLHAGFNAVNVALVLFTDIGSA